MSLCRSLAPWLWRYDNFCRQPRPCGYCGAERLVVRYHCMQLGRMLPSLWYCPRCGFPNSADHLGKEERWVQQIGK